MELKLNQRIAEVLVFTDLINGSPVSGIQNFFFITGTAAYGLPGVNPGDIDFVIRREHFNRLRSGETGFWEESTYFPNSSFKIEKNGIIYNAVVVDSELEYSAWWNATVAVRSLAQCLHPLPGLLACKARRVELFEGLLSEFNNPKS
jgi:hypothetical protein